VPSPKVIDICLRPLPSLSPIASPSTPSSLALPQRYCVYSITQSFPLPFYLHLVLVKVINFQSHRHFVLLLLFIHPFRIFFILAFGLHRLLVRPSERLSFIIFALYLPLEHSGVCVVFRLSSSQQTLQSNDAHRPSLTACKGTSVHFLTSHILSHSPPVHMYSPSSPLYYRQGSYLRPTTSRPNCPTTFQKSTHQQSSTSHVPTHSYLNSIGRT
jgi:hypothetical protein